MTERPMERNSATGSQHERSIVTAAEGGDKSEAMNEHPIYHYHRQYEVVIQEAAERLRRNYGSWPERHVDLAVFLSQLPAGFFFIGVLFDWIGIGLGVLALVLWIAAMAWLISRRRTWARRTARDRLCFTCAYSLKGGPVDERGEGVCPECGESFNVAKYLAPAKRYHRYA